MSEPYPFIRLLGDLRRDHEKKGNGVCTIFLMDLDDFHSKIAGPLDSETKLALLGSVFDWVTRHLPDRPTVYRHGRDSLLATYWDQPLNTVLPKLSDWYPKFTATPFHAKRGPAVRFTFTGAVAEFPLQGQILEEVVREAEDAVFEGKEAGKNRILVATPRRMVTKTSHYTKLQLRRLSRLADTVGVSDAQLLREALDDLIRKYEDTRGA